MSVTYVPSTATLVNIITTTPRTLLLPPANERQGRVITVKDVTGLANTNPITISTQGTNTFDGSSNIYTLSNAYTAATFVSRNNNWLLTSATPTNLITFSTLTGLGTAGYVSTSQLTSTVTGLGTSGYVSSSQLISTVTGITNNVSGVSGSQVNSTIDGLATSGYVSSSQLFSTIAALGTAGGDVTRWNLFSTTAGLGQIYLSSYLYPYALSTQLLSTTTGLGNFYLSTPSLASTVRNLGIAGYLSTQHLFSSIAGLGQIFISAPNTVLATQISTGVSTAYLNAQNSFVLTETANMMFTGQLTVSTNLFVNNAPLALNYTTTTPAFPLSITSPTGQTQNFRMTAGTGALTMTLDGYSNATIASEVPNVSRNPLTLQAYTINAVTSSFNFAPNTVANQTNNTQIIGSTISTGAILGNQIIFSSLKGDGYQLYNLTAPSTLSVYSTVTGYAASMNVVSTTTLQSTILGLPLYLGYLSTFLQASGGDVLKSMLYSTTAGLGQTYVSATNVVLATHISTGISTASMNAVNSYVITETTNSIFTGNLTVSTNLFVNNAPVALNYTTVTPAFPMSITSPTGQTQNFRMTAGTGALTMTLDGYSNATIASEVPNVSRNPLTLQAYTINAITSSFQFAPNPVLNETNNTQIIGSTISTSIILGNQLIFSSLKGDGSQIYNLTAVSTPTVYSTVTGYATSMNVVSTATLQSTVTGLPLYLGYLSTATIGPVISTALLTASSAQITTGINAGFIQLSNTITSNIWVATGVAASVVGTIQTSTDGLTWTNSLSGGFSAGGNGLAWNGKYWVAVGNDTTNKIQYSSNATNWLATSGATFSVQGNHVSWNGRYWIAVGTDATNTIKYSLDGITWINSSSGSFITSGLDVAWNGSMWVAVGSDTTAATAIRYSYDGLNWVASAATASSTYQTAVAWNGTIWLAGGTTTVPGNSISYSKDGINWSLSAAPFQSSATSIAWNGIFWLATGTDSGASYPIYSYDGLRWTYGTGAQFSLTSLYAQWNGSYWVAVGQDATNSVKYSPDGINWINSTANNFTTSVNGVAFSSNLTPSYQQANFRAQAQPIPLFFDSTNQFLFTPTSLVINNTLNINNRLDRVGINCNAPSYDLDIYGSANVSSVLYASSFVGDGSRLLNITTQTLLTSSLAGLGNIGYVSSLDFSTLTNLAISSISLSNYISTEGLNAALGSTTTSLITKFTAPLYISASFSTVTAFTLLVCTIQTSTVIASSIRTSTLISADSAFQRIITSSLRFFEGDGFITGLDVQNSNISTIALYTSSVKTNTIATSNLFIGSNVNQSLLQFYGLRGGFNNNVIVEQSTGSFTQELLLFNGSNSSNQVRIQTTGAFRLETGVSANLFPNMPQQTNANFLVDSNGSMNVRNWVFYVDALTNRIGLNLGVGNRPQVDFDMLGTFRAPNMVINTANISTLISINAGFSTILISSTTLLPASTVVSQLINTNTLNASTINATSSVFSTLLISSVLTTSSFYTIIGNAYNFTISSLSANTISTNLLFANNVYISTLQISTFNTNILATQRLFTSSLRYFEGDGFLTGMDIQNSNISTIALYTSSIKTNAIATSNLRIGSNVNQNILQFYGLTGGFNNNVITEQSTGSFTQELLLFNGSNSSNQVRIQTTGAFRLETGVSANLFPNMPQQTNATFLIDSNGSMNVKNWIFYVDALTNRIGLNLGVGNRPQVDFDMLGTFRAPNMVINTANISTLISINAGFSTILISSTTLLPASTVVSQLINTNTLNASTINATSSVFSTLLISSVLTTSSFYTIIGNAYNFTISSLSANTISTNLLFANNVYISTLQISTFNTNILATQRLFTSSLRFFENDGFLADMDIQNSNISTIALYTSSIKTNAIATSNLRIGSNVNQNILQFYGLTGNFNNNVITEQSTGSLTHELLLFNGSNSSNQVRIQTTGAFRLETGVSANLFPNMPQQTNATFLIDSNGSMNVKNWIFYVDALTNRIGLNLGAGNRPQVDFDMLGTFRAPNMVINTANISTLISVNAGFSTILISSTTLLPASTVVSQLINTNTLNASTINATSSVFSTLLISSVLTTSSFYTIIGNAYNFTISSLSANTISTNLLFINAAFVSSIQVSTLRANDTTIQRLFASSLRFYDGDGFIRLPDLQTSNVSTIAFYASSIATNGIITSNIGVNISKPQFMLDVAGNGRISTLFIDTGAMTSTTTTFSLSVWGAGGPARVGGTTWTQISDRRMKESIVEADYNKCYEDIKAIPLRRFTYTSTFFDTVPLRDRNVLGFIAQEVKELQPKSIVVSEAFGISDLNWLNIDQLNMSLYGAVKKLINDKEELTSSVIGLQTLLGFCMSSINI